MIQEGKPAIGSWVTLSDPAVVELMGLAGCDFVIIDIEHAPLDFQTVENMVRAAEVVGTTPLVRVGVNAENPDPASYGVGCTRGDCAARDGWRLGSSCRFLCEVRAEGRSRDLRHDQGGAGGPRWSSTEHVRTSNEQTMVIPMVEDVEGIENIEDILSVDGVDLVFIGPADLARAYGVTSEKDPPAVRDAIERAADAARRIAQGSSGFADVPPCIQPHLWGVGETRLRCS